MARKNRTAPNTLSYAVPLWDRLMFEVRADAETVSTAVDAVVAAANGEQSTAKEFASEVFSRLFSFPVPLENPSGPPWVRQAHETITSLPDFEALRKAVSGDADFSALAASQFLTSVAESLAASAADADAQERAASRKGHKPTKEEHEAAAAALAQRSAERMADSLAAAAQGAGERIAGLKSAMAGLLPGLEEAPPEYHQRGADRMALAEALARTPDLKDVLRKAGRISRLARASRETKTTTTREEVVDIERGSDLSRVLPGGLARLRHPLLRKLALKELVEGQALQYRLEGKEPLGRGPMVVLLDRSGSMQGEPERWASAAALALVGASQRERRDCTIVEFTVRPDRAVRLGKPKQAEELSVANPSVVARRLSKESALSSIAGRSSNGGTDFTEVMTYALQAGALDDRADMVIVTDGHANIGGQALEALKESKSRGLRVFVLTINGGTVTQAVSDMADVVVPLDAVHDVGAAIAAAMPS